VEALKDALALEGVDLTKFMNVGMDGAATMIGHKGGVSTLWRKMVRSPTTPFTVVPLTVVSA
jgi:hypothetical protein